MGLFHTAVIGAMWTTTSSVIRSLISLLQVSILTKFLEKADFGIVAIAVLFIGFTSIFLDLVFLLVSFIDRKYHAENTALYFG